MYYSAFRRGYFCARVILGGGENGPQAHCHVYREQCGGLYALVGGRTLGGVLYAATIPSSLANRPTAIPDQNEWMV